jgi:hypothetical protein
MISTAVTTEPQVVGGEGEALTDLMRCILAKVRELQSNGYSPAPYAHLLTAVHTAQLSGTRHDVPVYVVAEAHSKVLLIGSVSLKRPRYSGGTSAEHNGSRRSLSMPGKPGASVTHGRWTGLPWWQ